jgi:hypothetical protein
MPLDLVNNDIRGLIDSVNDGSTSAFMWEWFTTKPFVDAGQVRFVRYLIARESPPYADMTTLIYIDRLSAHAMAIVVDRCTSLARSRAVARVTRVPGGSFDVCDLIRRARQPRRAEHRVHQRDVWIP